MLRLPGAVRVSVGLPAGLDRMGRQRVRISAAPIPALTRPADRPGGSDPRRRPDPGLRRRCPPSPAADSSPHRVFRDRPAHKSGSLPPAPLLARTAHTRQTHDSPYLPPPRTPTAACIVPHRPRLSIWTFNSRPLANPTENASWASVDAHALLWYLQAAQRHRHSLLVVWSVKLG